MNFATDAFFGFLLIAWLLFVMLPARYRVGLLLLASYLFYATWSIPFIALIMLTTSVDYVISRRLASLDVTANAGLRRFLLGLGITINLVILAIFKYSGFLLSNAHGLASLCHISWPWPDTVSILLPLGISFYTFEAISYLVDVYRGQAPASNWWQYNVYIMYFPHLISGPIVRFKELVEQYREPLKLPSLPCCQRGIELIVLGLVFKVLIADPVSHWADPVFLHPTAASISETYRGVLAFTVQIYFDFMGYTHIARGVSCLFNMELPLNFNHPYVATSISDFWRRWHISLSRWIRDYLYIPLGGSRRGLIRTSVNLLITMTLAGLWHGAGWPFLLWGTYHGLLLAGQHVWQALWTLSFMPKLKVPHSLTSTLGWILTFALVVVGWVLFRVTHLNDAGIIIQHLMAIPEAFHEIVADPVMCLSIGFLLLTCWSGPWIICGLEQLYRPLPLWARTAVLTGVMAIIWLMTSQPTVPFIYFQF